MNIPKETIRLIKENVDIVDVISDYVRSLKKSGKNWTGLCPFHSEKNPSFSVSEGFGIYKCFSCGETGDVIKFIEKIENLSFVEAIVLLAKKAGIPLELSGEETKTAYKKEELIQFNHRLVELFHFFLLKKEEGKRALEYLKNRGIGEELICTFKIGYAPKGFNRLENLLRKKGFHVDFLKECGIFSLGEDGLKTLFFDRVIFPIYNYRGECVGFGGRCLDNEVKPKYLNTPETYVYKKSFTLYAIQLAKEEIKKSGVVFLVEGYVDTISCYKNGLRNVVAPCGTAITKEQIKLLARYAKEIVLLLDGDDAGMKGAIKALKEGANLENVKFSVITLPNAMDPDEYFLQYKLDDFNYLYENRIDAFEFCINYKSKNVNLKDYSILADVLKFLFEYISLWDNKIVRSVLLEKMAINLSISVENLEVEFSKFVSGEKNRTALEKITEKKEEDLFSLDENSKREIELLLYLHVYDKSKELVYKCGLEKYFFSNEWIGELYELSRSRNFSKGDFLDSITDPKFLNYVMGRLLSPIFDSPAFVLKNCVVDLISDLLKRYWLRKGDGVNEKIKLSEMYKDVEVVRELQGEKIAITNEILKLIKLQELKK